MTPINGHEAKQFFQQLATFSQRYFAIEIQDGLIASPWSHQGYESGQPVGAVIHYTADEELYRVLRWFLIPEFHAEVSAHAVVADRRVGLHDELAVDLPLVQELPATVFQVVPPDHVAWHARWANRRTYGIENVNAGPLRVLERSDDGEPKQFATWRSRDRKSQEWTMPWVVPYKTPVRIFGGWWSPYTPEQVETNVILLRYLKQRYPQLRMPWILGHEGHQERKRDPGPMFPLNGVRRAVWDDWKPVRRYDWFRLLEHDERSGETLRDRLVIDHARVLGSETPHPSPAAAWARFESAVRALPGKRGFGATGKTGLAVLGYHVADLEESLDTDEAQSVWLFQRMMGLVKDSKPGPITKAALVHRLEYLGFLSGGRPISSGSGTA